MTVHESYSSLKTIEEMLENVAAGIVIGIFRGTEGQFTSVNKFFCDMLGMSEAEVLGRRDSGDLNDDRQEPGLLEAIHPEDLKIVIDYFTSLRQGHGRQGEAVFRLITPRHPEGQYVSCNSSTVLQDDGSYTIYSVYTDASGRKASEAEYDRLVREVLRANPNARCSYRLNLTHNTCSDTHGADAFTHLLMKARTADDVFDTLNTLITDINARAQYHRDFSPRRLMERYLNGEKQFSFTYRRASDQGPRWVQTFYNLTRNPLSDDVEAIVYTLDIDRAHKEDQIARLLTQREFFAYGLVNPETHGIEYFLNNGKPVSKADDALTMEDVEGDIFSRLADGEDVDAFRQATSVPCILDELSRHETYTYTFMMDHKHMTINYRWLDETKTDIIFAISDVSAAVKQEEETKALLREALDHAENASQMKSDFLGSVSHDLRTPLNAILGYTRLALKEDMPDKVRDYMDKVLQAGNSMRLLVDDTLDLQRIESGKMQLTLQHVVLEDLMREFVTSTMMSAKEKDQTLTYDNAGFEGTGIMADPVRIRKIVMNLLTNAVKYTPQGGKIILTSERLRESDQIVSVKITVSDTGIGMSEEFMTRMFEPFSQARSSSLSEDIGFGLGLAIVKQTLSLMNGRIDVQSTLGEGSTFAVFLDFAKSDAVRVEQPKINLDDVDLSDLTILLAEDNAMNAEIAVEILNEYGANVILAGNGQEAVDLFGASQPFMFDLILMDLRMPVKDGYEATRDIRALARDDAHDIPVVALSADAYQEDVKKSLSAGMNAHIAKPIEEDKLLTTIVTLVHDV